MTTYPVLLRKAATNNPVEAVLTVGLTPERMAAAETAWGPLRRALGGAEHRHWDWALKRGLLGRPGARCLGIECGGDMQGMVMTNDFGFRARLDPDEGAPILYVDFLEVAPWNTRGAEGGPRYREIGTRLMEAAVVRSAALGNHRRVGLHALPQAEGFYRDGVGMTDLGPDPTYHWLVDFECTSEQAAHFLEED